MVWLIILLAVGIIVGNLLLLKHTANMKMPSLSQQQQRQSHDDSDDDPWRDDD